MLADVYVKGEITLFEVNASKSVVYFFVVVVIIPPVQRVVRIRN